MLVGLAVDLIDHRGQRRGFAGTRRACDQDEAARQVAEAAGSRWETENRTRYFLQSKTAGPPALFRPT
jgi:hypothetical protein